jgi:hypothetical protein
MELDRVVVPRWPVRLCDVRQRQSSAPQDNRLYGDLDEMKGLFLLYLCLQLNYLE